jgi:hypothetical protein
MKTIEQKIKEQIRNEVEKLKETYLTFDKNYRFSFKKDGDVYLQKGTTYDHPLLSNKVVWATEVQSKNIDMLVDVFFNNLINFNMDKWSEISKTENSYETYELELEYNNMMKEAYEKESAKFELEMAYMRGF